MSGNVAIISDIHGNLHALRAVLADMEEQGVTERVCLGDVIGYGANPRECIELVREHGFECLKGNHDEMVAWDGDLERVSAATREASLWTRKCLSAQERGWLADLPMTMHGSDYEAVHATLHHPSDWPYVLMADMAALSFQHQTKPLCFIGHTHRPALWVEGEPLGVDITSIENVRPHRRQLVNVGSDRDERACYAVYRREQQDIWWRRVTYDVEGAQRAIIEAGLPPYLAQRLALGR
jgi:predicted phosphodiesterase